MDQSLARGIAFGKQIHEAQTWGELEAIMDESQAAFTAGELTRQHCERAAKRLVERSREISEVVT